MNYLATDESGSGGDFLSTMGKGWNHVMEGSTFAAKVVFAVCVLVNIATLPLGRFEDRVAVGLLVPLTVDSGTLHRQAPGLDFFSIQDAGARLVLGGDPYSMEHPLAMRAPYATDFRYPPITLFWLALPLNVLPPWVAFFAWVGCLYFICWGLFFYCVGRSPGMIIPFTLFWLAFFPLIAERHLGQFSLFLGILLFLAIEGTMRGHRPMMWFWVPAAWLKLFPLAMAPSLFLWGWRRMVTVAIVLLVLVSTGWMVFSDGGYGLALTTRDLGGGFLGTMEPPYAGRQGVAAFVNVFFWKTSGHSLGHFTGWQPLPTGFDPVYFFSLLIATIYATFMAWVIWETRGRFSLPTLGILWLAWFFMIYDCWEHHYTALIPLVALMLLHGYLSWCRAIVLWVFLGAPSLWWPWLRMGYAGNPAAELLGFLYFLQRPVGLLILLLALLGGLERDLSRQMLQSSPRSAKSSSSSPKK